MLLFYALSIITCNHVPLKEEFIIMGGGGGGEGRREGGGGEKEGEGGREGGRKEERKDSSLQSQGWCLPDYTLSSTCNP